MESDVNPPIWSQFVALACPACLDVAVSSPDGFCPDCASRLPLVGAPFCPACGGELDGILDRCSGCLRQGERPWTKAVAVMKFEKGGRRLIHDFKYRDRPELALPLGALAVETLRSREVEADCVVPIPMHWTRRWARGFNQAELLAEIISRRTMLPLSKSLSRRRRTRRQATLNRRERSKNIQAAFRVTKRDFCAGRAILLVDDVLTTGATLAAAASALLDAGAEKVNVLVIARGL